MDPASILKLCKTNTRTCRNVNWKLLISGDVNYSAYQDKRIFNLLYPDNEEKRNDFKNWYYENAPGTAITWGSNHFRQYNREGIDLTNVKSIACGSHHSVALKNDGTVVTWGSNVMGQYNSSGVSLTNIKSIACGESHSVAIKI